MAHLLLSTTDIEVISHFLIGDKQDRYYYPYITFPGGEFTHLIIDHRYSEDNKDQYLISTRPFKIIQTELDELVLRVTNTYILERNSSHEEKKFESSALVMMKEWLSAPSTDSYIILKPKEDIMGVFHICYDYLERSYTMCKQYPEEDNIFEALPETISSIILDYHMLLQKYTKESLSYYLYNLSQLLSRTLNVEVDQGLVDIIIDYIH